MGYTYDARVISMNRFACLNQFMIPRSLLLRLIIMHFKRLGQLYEDVQAKFQVYVKIYIYPLLVWLREVLI